MTVESAEVQEKMRELKQYLNQYYLEYERIVRNIAGPVFTSHEKEVLSQGESSSSGLRGKRCVELAFAQFSSQNSRTRLERSELDIYLDDPRVVVRAGENFNVLAWWKKKLRCLSYLVFDGQRLLVNSCKHGVLRICL